MRRRLAALALLAALGCAHARPSGPDARLAAFSLPTVDGERFVLGSQQGKVVLVSFFATWCFPCVAETEVLKRLQAGHPDDLQVVSVGMDLDGDRVLKPFRDEMQLPYPVLVADEDTLKGRGPFGPIHDLPTTFVLDKQGQLRDGFTGVPDQRTFERVLAPLLEAK